MALNRVEVIQHVKMMLGFPAVDVELDESNDGPYDVALAQSMRLYNRFRPKVLQGWFTATPDVMEYDFDAMSLPYGSGVYDVRRPVRGGNMLLAYESSLLGLPANMMRLTYGREVGDYLAILGELEQIERATAREFDWVWREKAVGPDMHWHLYIHPKPHEGWELEYDYISPSTLAEVRANDETWLLEHVTAQMMVMLGRARGKWSQELPMDGRDLANEGKQALKDLEQQIRARRLPYLVPRQG